MSAPNVAGWRSVAFLIVLVASAAAFVFFTMCQLGTFPSTKWIIAQPESWQGGLEGCALAILLIAAQRLKNLRVRLLVCAFLSELYLRRHGVDTAIFVDLVFVELLIALGGAIQYWFGVRGPDGTEKYLRNFLLGLLAWSACAWLLSALGHGSLGELRALSLILGIAGFSTRPQLFSVYVYRRIAVTPFAERGAYAALFTWFLMLCAKTDTTVGFDPLWYGLRGELVLLDHGSVYHSLGLVSAVHYFPKLYEMLLLPVSGLGSASVISGVSLMMFVLTAATAHALVRRVGVDRWEVRIAAIAACVTLPAIANTALDPKPDTLAALLVLIGWLNASQFVETRKLSAAFWSASSLILATQAKLSVLPFATVVALAAAWFVVRDRRRLAIEDHAPDRRTAMAVFALAVIVTVFVTARTIVLAGMPTIGPDAFFHLWTSIGFELKPPAGTLSWTSVPDWGDIPQLAVDLLFRPQLLEHIRSPGQATSGSGAASWFSPLRFCAIRKNSAECNARDRQTAHVERPSRHVRDRLRRSRQRRQLFHRRARTRHHHRHGQFFAYASFAVDDPDAWCGLFLCLLSLSRRPTVFRARAGRQARTLGIPIFSIAECRISSNTTRR